MKDRPGLIFIRNPFTVRGQRYWIAKCLRDYPKAPHIVNLNENNFNEQVIADWWKALQECKDGKERERLKNGMRWTTLGYHHDWDTKIYSEDKRHRFPDDLATLNRYFATALGFDHFSAEAAIVNYYPIGTTLAGHTDHSEKNLNAPLFSISFGQTAIFLLGGQTKEEKPSALFLKSGDVVVGITFNRTILYLSKHLTKIEICHQFTHFQCMSKASRLCYHAVPRVMKTDVNWLNSLPPTDNETTANDDDEIQNMNCKRRKLSDDEDRLDDNVWSSIVDNKFWRPFAVYLSGCRININVRQVLEYGEHKLD